MIQPEVILTLAELHSKTGTAILGLEFRKKKLAREMGVIPAADMLSRTSRSRLITHNFRVGVYAAGRISAIVRDTPRLSANAAEL